MNRVSSILFAAWLVSTASASSAEATNSVLTCVDLVRRLTDLEHLATLPAPGEKTAQFSSYDRASRYDEKSGKYVNWGANGDNNGIIRKEDGKLVFAEMEGPGCIWRIWSAAPKAGHVRIYLDGDTNPAVDLPFAEYFSGTNAPFTRPALVHVVSRGCNNYTPIPFQKSCKIVADENWGAYYHFGYSTFPKGTLVPTFKRQLSATENAALDEANDLLTGSEAFGAPFNGQGMQSMLNEAEFTEVRPGNRLEVKHDGPAAIVSIRVKFANLPPQPADRDAVRAILLRFTGMGKKLQAFGRHWGISSALLLARIHITHGHAVWHRTVGGIATGSCRSRQMQMSFYETRICFRSKSNSTLNCSRFSRRRQITPASTRNGIATNFYRPKSSGRLTGRCSRPRAADVSSA
jgi:hypothetical protein